MQSAGRRFPVLFWWFWGFSSGNSLRMILTSQCSWCSLVNQQWWCSFAPKTQFWTVKLFQADTLFRAVFEIQRASSFIENLVNVRRSHAWALLSAFGLWRIARNAQPCEICAANHLNEWNAAEHSGRTINKIINWTRSAQSFDPLQWVCHSRTFSMRSSRCEILSKNFLPITYQEHSKKPF